MLNSENSANEAANSPSSSTSKKFDDTQKSPNYTKITLNYTDDI